MTPFASIWPQRAPTWSRLALYLLLTAAITLIAGCAGTGYRSAAFPGSAEGGAAIVIDDHKRTDVVLTALSLLQTPYRYGGATPGRGFDCSGFVQYVFARVSDPVLPHNTHRIAQVSRPIPKSQLQPGDFVFFNTLNSSFSHMGIYIGEGRFINAPSSGGRVRIDSLESPYYARHFEQAGTLFRL